MESGPVGEGAVPGDRLPPRAAVPQPAPGRREGETHQEQVRVCATLQFVSYQRNKNNCSYYSSIISTGLAVSVCCFVDFDFVVAMSAEFCLGCCKPCRIGSLKGKATKYCTRPDG